MLKYQKWSGPLTILVASRACEEVQVANLRCSANHDARPSSEVINNNARLNSRLVFLFGGLQRSDRPRRYRLEHGDIVVWGGPSRLFFHGVAPLADGEHALLGRQRINLTFRKAR